MLCGSTSVRHLADYHLPKKMRWADNDAQTATAWLLKVPGAFIVCIETLMLCISIQQDAIMFEFALFVLMLTRKHMLTASREVRGSECDVAVLHGDTALASQRKLHAGPTCV